MTTVTYTSETTHDTDKGDRTHTKGTVTVTDLTGQTHEHCFVRILQDPRFADLYAPILLTFSMLGRHMPQVPQVFACTMSEATKMADAIGQLYVDRYAAHVAEMRADLDAIHAAEGWGS